MHQKSCDVRGHTVQDFGYEQLHMLALLCTGPPTMSLQNKYQTCPIHQPTQ
ncbi:hypothetical protein DPMN_110883 [Dreissena polymorpha]|uniref:Uncharacterized protein n=1 Tax=Dreissena polymorpha TaxID=45954 RepID=A0A9D4KDT0_DREPO|nr:hypothetical protein DPMN_110883 [Dreissena polymorpha]